jgi:hypothetical protein
LKTVSAVGRPGVSVASIDGPLSTRTDTESIIGRGWTTSTLGMFPLPETLWSTILPSGAI